MVSGRCEDYDLLSQLKFDFEFTNGGSNNKVTIPLLAFSESRKMKGNSYTCEIQVQFRPEDFEEDGDG